MPQFSGDQAVVPKGLVVRQVLAKAGRRHAGDPADFTPHVRLVGEARIGGDSGEVRRAAVVRLDAADECLLDADEKL